MIIIGHRGACGHEPENTLRSFERAIKLGAEMIELDTRLCRSGEVVVIHDHKVNKTTDGKGRISDMTIKQLKILDAGKGEKIPTLQEVFDLVDKRAGINIELKSEGTPGAVSKLISRYIRKGWKKEHFLVSSFDVDLIKEFNEINNKIRIGMIVEKRGKVKEILKFSEEMKAYSIHLRKNLVTQKIVNESHKNNIKAFAWTINSIKDMKRMQGFGIDGIFTDYPEIFS